MKSLLCLLAMLFAFNFSYAQWSGTSPIYYNSGNVGIGITTPLNTLHIYSTVGADGLSIDGNNNPSIVLRSSGTIRGYAPGLVTSTNGFFEGSGPGDMAFRSEGHRILFGSQPTAAGLVVSGISVGIGTINPTGKLHIASNTASGTSDVLTQYTWSTDLVHWGLRFEQQYNASFGRIQYNWIMKAGTNSDVSVMSFANGLVGIGTQSPDQKLTVNGTIHATEIKVDLGVPGPDYVFEKSYKLKSLQEVAKYVSINKHLSEIPSAKVMEQNGVNVSEMNMKLLQKVEELTLYLIQENKEKKEQQAQIDQLKQQLETLSKEIRKNQ